MTIKAVLIDLDGTLLDTVLDLHAAADAMLADLGRPPVLVADIRSYVGRGIPNLVKRVLAGNLEAANDPKDLPRAPTLPVSVQRSQGILGECAFSKRRAARSGVRAANAAQGGPHLSGIRPRFGRRATPGAPGVAAAATDGRRRRCVAGWGHGDRERGGLTGRRTRGSPGEPYWKWQRGVALSRGRRRNW